MNDDLKYIFSNINDWLKFAEAKSAGLLALNIAAVLGLLQSQAIFVDDLKDGQGILLVVFCISSLIALYSLIPKLTDWIKFYKVIPDLDKELDRRKKANIPIPNCLYFGDISCLDEEMFSSLATGVPLDQHPSLIRFLIHQIVINAKIAYQKYRIFTIASWITFVGYTLSIVMVVFHHFDWLPHPHK